MDPVDNPVKDKDPLPKDLIGGPVEDRGRLSIDSITRSIPANHSHLKETIAGPVRAKIPDIDTLSGTVQSKNQPKIRNPKPPNPKSSKRK
jgi:hypothetical protein